MTDRSHSNHPQTTLLRRALQGNAVFSTLTGAALALDARYLAKLFEVDAPLVFAGVGVTVVIFAVALFFVASPRSIDPRLGFSIAVLDALWVAGSAALLLGGWVPISPAGKWLVAILADIVAVFAALEFYGWWRARRPASQPTSAAAGD